MSEPGEDLHCKLQQLQSRYTWDIRKEDLELDDLSKQLQHDIDLQLGQWGALAHSYRFQSYVRYLQGKPEEALSLLTESEEKTKECYRQESERRLIVTYGDLAWLKYHTKDYTQSQTYCQRVSDILVKHPADSFSDLHPEVYGEKGWTYLKFSKSYYTKAKECFSKALELQPDNWEWNSGYAITLYRTEENIKEWYPEESPATKQLRRALEKNADDGVLLSLLALKLVNYAKHEEAKDLVKKALEVGQDNTQVMRYIGKYFRLQNQLDESISVLKNMLRKTSQSSFIHHQLALCYERKKNNLVSKRPQPVTEIQHWRRLCIEHLEKAVAIKMGFHPARALLALHYAQESKIMRAQEMFDDVLKKLEDESPSIRQYIYRLYAEFCYYSAKKPDLGITYYKKALEFGIITSEGRHCVKKLKRIAEQRLKGNSRGVAFAYGILGAVARAEGNRSCAVSYFERALEEDADNDEYLSALCELRLELSPQKEDQDHPEATCETVPTRTV
ncbi:interferon-induced protein with tetratricopeptide repeats 5-like [Archocentrus centrarchus]|uniref:interferon-induced protein with tetratricopeptide repeats 5-like n=1 Tax=Archocentrus centrarchus TaxID=63155 RepID=UPI0011E9E314|nr:interferon-induced protein with tetratricopeptide repeats 5-like [Archocentrus centrarchus]